MESAPIHESVEIGPEAEVGQFCVLEADVVIGPRTRLGHGVIVRAGTRLGADCVVGDGSILGSPPAFDRDRSSPAPSTFGNRVRIGDRVVVHDGVSVGDAVTLEDSVVIGRGASLDPGVFVGSGSVVGADALLGADARVGQLVFIAGDTVIGPHCILAPMVATSNDNALGRGDPGRVGPQLERGARLGAGALVLGGKTVGEDAFVAAGALVTRDVPSKMMVRGLPAKIWRPVPQGQLLEKQKPSTAAPPKRR